MTPSAILPMPVPRNQFVGHQPGDPAAPVVEDYCADLALVYSAGPPYGDRLVTPADLGVLGEEDLRPLATGNLARLLGRVEIHGLPPVLTLSFDGIESTLLVADEVWASVADQVEGDVVVGAPARDVLFVTGSRSQPGLGKIHRACERIFFAGHANLLSRGLLIRRGAGWELF